MAKSSPKRSSAPPRARPTGSASGRRRAGEATDADKPERSSKPAGKSSSKSSSKPSTSRPAKPTSGKPTSGKPTAGKPAAKRRSKALHEHTPTAREERDGVRLQKYLASAGVASRRHAEELITGGHVQVNGQVVRELGTRVFGDRDRVTVRGELIKPETKVYHLLNKPDAMVCSAVGSVDERGRPTVLSLMHGISERLYPVGRLDYHSRGVLLLTNDGELAEALTHPSHGVVKTYHVKFQGKLDDADEQALRDGVTLDDGAITRPLTELFAFRETGSNVWYQIGLTEGLNRQIRRMGDAIGHPVLKLIRVAIGDITADGLEEGQHRPLNSTEVAQLLAAIRIGPEPTRKPKPAAASTPTRAARKPPRRPSSSESAGVEQAPRRPASKPPARATPSTSKPSSAKRAPARAARPATPKPTRPTRK